MATQTLADIIETVYSRLDNNDRLYPRADIVDELNDSMKAVNLFTGAIQRSVTIGTVGDDINVPTVAQLIYPTPPGMVFITAVDYEGRSLSMTSLRALAAFSRSWAYDFESTGRPVKFWVPVGVSRFVINPMDRQGGRELMVTGVVDPPALVNDADLMPLGNEFADDVTDLTASMMPVREGGRVFTAAVMGIFAEFIQRMRTKAAYANLAWPTYYQKLRGKRPEDPKAARISE